MRIAAIALPLLGAVDRLAGSWTGEVSGGIFEEHWMKPAGGTMVGMGRLVVRGKTVLIEFIKIMETKDGRLAARIEGPGGAHPMDFRLKPGGRQAKER